MLLGFDVYVNSLATQLPKEKIIGEEAAVCGPVSRTGNHITPAKKVGGFEAR